MATDLHPDIVAAIREFSQTRLGRRYNRYTQKKYDLPGWKVLGKTNAAEFGGRPTRGNRDVVSSAGARGPFQFIRSTRDAFVQQHGVDPWKNDRQAVRAAALHHLTRGGIAGYNPGMPSYENLVLGQKLNRQDRRTLRGAGGSFDPGRPARTEVSLQSRTIPGQSFEDERRTARRDLLLGGDINMNRLLEYKRTVNSLKDIPSRKVAGDLKVTRTPGQAPRVGGLPGPNANVEGRPWGGSKFAGRKLVQASGLPVGSRKRPTKSTASGGVSDHWDQNTDSYAWDLMVTGAEGTKKARKLARMLGVRNWDGGSWLNVTKEVGGVKYRFQLGWNLPDHYDHIHLGVDRVDTPG